MLEPCAVKAARTVLRGVGAGNSPPAYPVSMAHLRVIDFFGIVKIV
jgi:hypothetical protein